MPGYLGSWIELQGFLSKTETWIFYTLLPRQTLRYYSESPQLNIRNLSGTMIHYRFEVVVQNYLVVAEGNKKLGCRITIEITNVVYIPRKCSGK